MGPISMSCGARGDVLTRETCSIVASDSSNSLAMRGGPFLEVMVHERATRSRHHASEKKRFSRAAASLTEIDVRRVESHLSAILVASTLSRIVDS